MNGLCRRLFGDLNHLVHVQIRLGRGRWTNQESLICLCNHSSLMRVEMHHFNVHRVSIGLGIDCHGLDAQFLGGFHDPHGDFASICNQDLVEKWLF